MIVYHKQRDFAETDSDPTLVLNRALHVDALTRNVARSGHAPVDRDLSERTETRVVVLVFADLDLRLQNKFWWNSFFARI